MEELKQYHILKADPAGEPWSGQAGGMFQTWFLSVEGVEGTIMCNRKTSSPHLSGPTWGEMEDAVSKKGKPMRKFHPKPAPEGTTSPQTALPLQTGADTLSWANAVLAASQSVTRGSDANDVLRFARELMNPQKDDRDEPDKHPTESDVDEINIDDIPFS